MAIGFGINAWVWTSPFTNDSLHLLDKARQMGFDMFEIGLEDASHVDAARLKERLDATGMRFVCCGAFGPSRDMAHEEPRYRQESVDYIAAAAQLCEKVGANLIAGPMYSSVGKRRHISKEQKKVEWDLAVAGISKASKIAANHGVRLAIEPLNRFETDLINTAEQAHRLVGDIGQKNVGLHLDSFHMNIEEKDDYAAIKLAGAQLFHFHACENDRGAPGSGTNINWDAIARGLKEINYQGDAVIESFTPDNKAIAAAAAIWRPLAKTQDDLARDGLAFLKRKLA